MRAARTAVTNPANTNPAPAERRDPLAEKDRGENHAE
jgi:hypothetical protein